MDLPQIQAHANFSPSLHFHSDSKSPIKKQAISFIAKHDFAGNVLPLCQCHLLHLILSLHHNQHPDMHHIGTLSIGSNPFELYADV